MICAPTVLVFDVNETLIDIESIAPVFEQMFGDRTVMRQWFGQLITYSMTMTMAGNYVDFFTLGQAVLQMLAAVHRVHVADDDMEDLKHAMLTMPAHPDVADGLKTLRDNGFRLVTLTNSPPNPTGLSPLQHAGLSQFFERQFSVDACRAFKPSPATFRYVCDELGVAPAHCMKVAAHAWDLVGAQSVGFQGAMIARPGNATLHIPGLPDPTVVVNDLRELAVTLTTMA